MKIAVISNIVSAVPAGALNRFLNAVRGKCELSFGTELKGVVGEGPFLPDEELFASADAAVVFGGDGTILTAARRAAPHHVPIYGINTGHLGFLSSASSDEAETAAVELLSGKLDMTERIMLSVSVLRGGREVYSSVALNDIVVNRSYGRLTDFSITHNSRFAAGFRADGVIISTPTGSTAYSLACGGPLLFPELDVFLITPICPHLLGLRPMVITSEGCININVSESGAAVSADGQAHFDILPSDVVRVTKAPYKALLLAPAGRDFFNLVRRKLTK